MEIFYGFDNLPSFINPVVTVGSYDGVHRGHRELLGLLTDKAREYGGQSVVITFVPHPRQVLEGKSPKLLNSVDEKALLLEQVGIDVLIVAPFSTEFSRISPESFVVDFLVAKVGMRALVVGYNHHFGSGNKGDYKLLCQLEQQHKFDTIEVSQKRVDQSKVSSTVLRNVISQGKMALAQKYLGFPYIIIATIDQNGELLFEREHKLLPPMGIYNVVAQCSQGECDAKLTITPDYVSIDVTAGCGFAAGTRVITLF